MRSFYRAILAMLSSIAVIFVCCCLTTRTPRGRDTDTCSDVATATIGIQLEVAPLYQECDKWCWAASVAMVSNYYGHRVKQCTLATQRLNTAGHDCCRERCGTGCNELASNKDVTDLLTSTGLRRQFVAIQPSEKEMQAELLAGRPIVVQLYNGINPAHLTVVTGFIPGNCQVGRSTTYTFVDPGGDPSFTKGSTVGQPLVSEQTYWQLLHGPNGHKPWGSAWIGINPIPPAGG